MAFPNSLRSSRISHSLKHRSCCITIFCQLQRGTSLIYENLRHRKVLCISRTMRARAKLAHRARTSHRCIAKGGHCIAFRHCIGIFCPYQWGTMLCVSNPMQHRALANICSVKLNGPFLLFAARYNSEQSCFDDSYRYLFSAWVYHAIYHANVYFFRTIYHAYFFLDERLYNNIFWAR